MQHTLLAATAAPQMDATGCNCCTAQQLLQRSRFVGPSPDQQLQHAAGSSCRSNQRTRQLPPIRVHRAHGGVRLRPGEGSPASGVLRARARCGATWLLARAVPSCIIDARFVACIFASLVACLVARMHALLHALLHVLLHTHCCAPCCTPRCTPCCTNAWLHALPSRGTLYRRVARAARILASPRTVSRDQGVVVDEVVHHELLRHRHGSVCTSAEEAPWMGVQQQQQQQRGGRQRQGRQGQAGRT